MIYLIIINIVKHICGNLPVMSVVIPKTFDISE